jgi:hypothetical protein
MTTQYEGLSSPTANLGGSSRQVEEKIRETPGIQRKSWKGTRQAPHMKNATKHLQLNFALQAPGLGRINEP